MHTVYLYKPRTMKKLLLLITGIVLTGSTQTLFALTYTVANNNDSGAGSLREAIEFANASVGVADIISFAGLGTTTITLQTPLPYLSDDAGVTIDGTTATGFVANTNQTGAFSAGTTMKIVLDGATYSVSTGISMDPSIWGGANNIIRGLVLTGFTNGILTAGNTSSFSPTYATSPLQVYGCYIGTDITGTIYDNRTSIGINISSSYCIIGSGAAADRNLITGGTGIYIIGASVGSIKGNIIGLAKNGTNFSNCVYPTGPKPSIGINLFSYEYVIGGVGAGEGNVISGNALYGITMQFSYNNILGNIIGPDADGVSNAKTNDQSAGIYLDNGASDDTIGGTVPGARNIISGNTLYGIYSAAYIFIPGTKYHRIWGNYIGPDINGAAMASSTQQYGIYLRAGCSNNTIGGSLPGEPNNIGFNSISGIYITRGTQTFSKANFNLISRNLIYNTNTAMIKAIDLAGTGNDNYAKPTILSISTTAVSGTSGTNGDIVEVFKTDGACVNAMQYLGSGTVAGGAWSVNVTGLVNNGDQVIANVHNANGNTSEFASCIVLPIELLSFSGKNTGSVNMLEWVTASEINNDFFTIERSIDGMTFETIGIVDAAGNSTASLSYSLKDQHPGQLTYYRLKQTDYNGDYTYSQTISLAMPGIDIISIYPNPASDHFQYSISSSDETEAKVLVIDVLGRTVFEKSIMVMQGINNYKIEASEISNGAYTLQLATTKGLYRAQKQFSIK